MKIAKGFLGLALGSLATTTGHTRSPPVKDWNYVATPEMQDMFHTAVNWNDQYWDDTAGYLVAVSSNPGRYDTRHTAWYATQLLARNGPGDVERAIRIFNNVIDHQYLNPAQQWYGDYQQSPSEPQPGSLLYPDLSPYSTWDPNIRDFIGCAWLIALNDYDHLLPSTMVTKVERSLHIAALGDLYRVGGADGDNLYPCYSNPWLMGSIFLAWVSHRMNDKNISDSAESYAQQAYDLWSQYHTLSEFNSPTYLGVSMWALSLWNQYSPEGSLLKKYGSEMLTGVWNDLAAMYNANLRNLAGPWDRTYGYDMKEYASLVAACIWGVIGRQNAPFPSVIAGMYHQDDFAFYPLFALAMPEMTKYLSDDARQALVQFQGERSIAMQAISPPFDKYPRNITAWLSENITIGAQTVAQDVVGGASINPGSFSPAVIQWAMEDGQIGTVSYYPTQYSIHAVASPRHLYISYPNATWDNGVRNAPTTFQFIFSGLNLRNGINVMGLEGLPGLCLTTTTNALPDYSIIYDTDQAVNEFKFYNITYTMPDNLTGVPYISLDII